MDFNKPYVRNPNIFYREVNKDVSEIYFYRTLKQALAFYRTRITDANLLAYLDINAIDYNNIGIISRSQQALYEYLKNALSTYPAVIIRCEPAKHLYGYPFDIHIMLGSLQMNIEYDGIQHFNNDSNLNVNYESRRLEDLARDKNLMRNQVKVVRISHQDVKKGFNNSSKINNTIALIIKNAMELDNPHEVSSASQTPRPTFQ